MILAVLSAAGRHTGADYAITIEAQTTLTGFDAGAGNWTVSQAARKELETRLAAVLKTDASFDAKAFVCRRLTVITFQRIPSSETNPIPTMTTGQYGRKKMIVDTTAVPTSVNARHVPLPSRAEMIEATLPPTNVTPGSARMRGDLIDDDGMPTAVYVYWGFTDGSMDPGAWDSHTNLGVRASFADLGATIVDLLGAPATPAGTSFKALL